MRVVFRCDPALRDVLPQPVAAREALPAWLRDMPREAFSDAHGAALRTVKHCPPFVDAMAFGFVMPLPCDVMVADGELSWNWDPPPSGAQMHTRAPISFHVPEQVAGTPLHAPGQVVVKFNSFWTIELEPGWSLFATHPANREDLPFRLLSGLVDSDMFHDVGILFPAIWCDPAFSGTLPRGTPVAQCFAVRREPVELAFETLDAERVARYDALATRLLSEAGVYRREYRAVRLRAGDQGGSQPLQMEP